MLGLGEDAKLAANYRLAQATFLELRRTIHVRHAEAATGKELEQQTPVHGSPLAGFIF